MAARHPIVRQPWYLAAWILLLAALPLVLFGPLVLGLALFVASLAADVVAIRQDRARARDRNAPEPPRD